MKAKVAYTYGWTAEYIDGMDYRTFMQYWTAITPLEAEKAILDIKTGVYPHLKKSKQKELFGYFKRTLTTHIDKGSKKLATMKDVALTMARMMGRG